MASPKSWMFCSHSSRRYPKLKRMICPGLKRQKRQTRKMTKLGSRARKRSQRSKSESPCKVLRARLDNNFLN